jgi:hypothetical protein
VTKVKDDPTDNTTTLSALCLKGFNADFDGDAMTMMFMLDNYMSAQIGALSPHKNMVDYKRPYKLDNVAAIPSPVASATIAWLKGTDRVALSHPARNAFLEELAA